jgi:hypothetical protein
MSTRAATLAARVEQGAQALLGVVEGCSEAEWRTACGSEGVDFQPAPRDPLSAMVRWEHWYLIMRLGGQSRAAVSG